MERCSTSLIIWEKIKSRTTVWSSSSTSEYLPKWREIRIVIKSKFMSPMHSETKQMNSQTLEQRKVCWSKGCWPRRWKTKVCLRSILLAGQDIGFLKVTVGMRVAGAMPFSLVSGKVTGWYFRNLNHQPFSQSEVQCLCLACHPHPQPGWGS